MSFGEDRVREFVVPEPFLRRVLLNYVERDGETFVIPTDPWIEEVRLCGFLTDAEGGSYAMTEVGIGSVEVLFREKYGARHFAKYFSGTRNAYRLSRIRSAKANVPEILEAIFDHASSKYEQTVETNWVQTHMREMSRRMLEKYVRNGCTLLDLGCGTMLETSCFVERASVTGADLSAKMLELCKESFKKMEAKPKLVKINSDLHGTLGTYDVIFSSYGLLNLVPLPRLRDFLLSHLADGGYFIGGFWNSAGAVDLLFSLAIGRVRYVRERLSGRVGAGLSRFPMAVSPVGVKALLGWKGWSVMDIQGVSSILPPYNFRGLLSHLDPVRMTRLDRFAGGLPLLSRISDYFLIVLRRGQRS